MKSNQLENVKQQNIQLGDRVKQKGIKCPQELLSEAFNVRIRLQDLVDKNGLEWNSIFLDDFTLEDKELEQSILNLLLLYQLEINKVYVKLLEEN